MVTLLQAAQKVAYRRNANVNDSTVMERIKGHVNDACKEVWESHPWSFRWTQVSQALTAGEDDYTLASTVADVDSAWIAADRRQLRIVPFNRLPVPDTTATGDPWMLAITGYGPRSMRVYPTPSQNLTLTLNTLSTYTDISLDADTNILLMRYPWAVVESALWREMGSAPDNRSDAVYQKAEKMWDTAKSEDAILTPRDNPYPIWNPRG